MPDVDLVLKEMDSDDQMEALGAGRLDAGAVRLPVDRRGIELACVMREPILLAVCEGHPLAGSNAPSLRTSSERRLSCTRRARDGISTTSCPACYVRRR
jgi:DNA-binding transcriptional LysR family regulator